MKRLDLGKILHDKNPRLARFVPRVLVRWIEKVICVGKMNEILDLYEDRSPIGFVDGALEYIGVKYCLHGVENIPSQGKLIFISNHPLGGVDGMILATAIDSIRPSVKLIVNDILLNIEPLKPIFVGVNKHGGQRSDFSKIMDELYAGDWSVINFPAGMCSRLIEGKIQDTPWRKSYVRRTIDSSRLVVPTYFEARNSMFFYRFARLRIMLGIKANLEMTLLPRQVFYQKGRTVDIYFGEPIRLDDSRSVDEWNQILRQKTYSLCKK